MRKINKTALSAFLLLLCYISCIAQSSDAALPEENAQEQKTPGECSDDDLILDSLKTIMSNYAMECLKIGLSLNGYENGIDETWYFDSLAVICGYHSTWNMEGTSGEEFYWFDKARLSAVYEEKYGQTDEPEITFLTNLSDHNNLIEYESVINARKQVLYDLIKENLDKINEDENNVSIYLEETKYYGMEFIETTKIYIDILLFNQLFRK